MNCVEGVLVEGVDYIGKTTACGRLAELLTARGVPVRENRCYLVRDPLITFLEDRASESDDPEIRDGYYSAAISADMLAARAGIHDDELASRWIVQDRHWLTQIGRNRFFAREGEPLPSTALELSHVPFTHNVLLQSNVAAKRARAAARPPKSPRDRLLAENPRLHQQYDDFLRGLLPEENWLVLDTSGLSTEETCARILDFLGEAPFQLGARAGVV
jgi:thymidylate kinase